ncbi:hypothetical protein DH2020_005662 [Rehmannia glutinosa]|uniref:Reticulon-like protein n=1 Tax=Rehmannia glutinosa TaxID=99300 RepID=A0ABR0XH80_REHGL
MADYHTEEEKKGEANLMDQISDKIHGRDSSSSSSDSEDEKKPSLKAKVNRLFGREKPVHGVFGGGKRLTRPAMMDVNEVSGGVLGGATAIWVLFGVLEYHLLTLVCHGLMLGLVILFLWSNASTFIKKTPPRIPEISIPKEPVLDFASALRIQINRAFATLRDIASGKDLKKFLSKYEDKVDFYAEKALAELKKQYAVFDAKVLSKIPRGPLKDKKSE